MASITPSGGGRAAIGDRLSLIRASPRSPSLAVMKALVVERRADETTPEDFLDSDRRRVGRSHDAAELMAGSPAASDCPNVTIYAHWAADPLALAMQRRRRAGTKADGTSHVSRFWSIEVSAKGCNEAGEGAGMRFANLKAESGPTFQELDLAGRVPGSPDWQNLEMRRDRDCLVGVLVESEIDGGTIALLNHHAISQLYEDGYVTITADETVHDSWEISDRTMIDEIEHVAHVVRGIIAEISITADLVIKVAAAGTATAAILRFLKVI